MKRVSFEIAKILKDAGYPQVSSHLRYNSKGGLGVPPNEEGYVIPTYLEVWLWLWRERNIMLSINTQCGNKVAISIFTGDAVAMEILMDFTDPEEAIIAAIEYLVTNKLIK